MKPAPNADTSRSRVISFQWAELSIISSTRTGNGSEIRWIRLAELSAAGSDRIGSMERGCSVWEANILSK
jgi:hypothetical protein